MRLARLYTGAMTDFGTDLTIKPDLSFELVSGKRNLALALMRRLVTPRGGLFYDPNYGTDLRRYLNEAYGSVNDALKYEVEQVAMNEVEKDPRVLDSSAVLEFGQIGQRSAKLTVIILTRDGPFTLVATADLVDRGGITFDSVI